MDKKPSLEEVLEYTKGNVRRKIFKRAKRLPYEQREEIEAAAYLRVCEAYDKIDVTKGWKAFVQKHCFGAVMDYLKSGHGFEESRKSLNKPSGTKEWDGIINRRLDLSGPGDDGVDIDLEKSLGYWGVFADERASNIKIKWDLVARMASKDKGIHCMALWLKGNTLDQIGQMFRLSPQRIWALIKKFVDNFDDPMLCDEPWQLQTIYAFGLCGVFGMVDIDQVQVFGFAIGWKLIPVDLDDLTPIEDDAEKQLDMNMEAP